MTVINFQSVLTRRNELLHRQAVWGEVMEHLRRFLDTDIAPAKHGIVTQGGGMTVPQRVIEEVVTEIEKGPAEKITKELTTIDKSEVAENVRQESEASPKGKAKVRPGAKRQPSPAPRRRQAAGD